MYHSATKLPHDISEDNADFIKKLEIGVASFLICCLPDVLKKSFTNPERSLSTIDTSSIVIYTFYSKPNHYAKDWMH